MGSHCPHLSYGADASGGKPVQRHGCSCTRLPAGGGQIAAPQPEWPASDPPRDAADKTATGTRGLHRPGPTERWAKDDRGPLDRSRGSDWPGQNLPERMKVSNGEHTVLIGILLWFNLHPVCTKTYSCQVQVCLLAVSPEQYRGSRMRSCHRFSIYQQPDQDT